MRRIYWKLFLQRKMATIMKLSPGHMDRRFLITTKHGSQVLPTESLGFQTQFVPSQLSDANEWWRAEQWKPAERTPKWTLEGTQFMDQAHGTRCELPGPRMARLQSRVRSGSGVFGIPVDSCTGPAQSIFSGLFDVLLARTRAQAVPLTATTIITPIIENGHLILEHAR